MVGANSRLQPWKWMTSPGILVTIETADLLEGSVSLPEHHRNAQGKRQFECYPSSPPPPPPTYFL